MTSRRTLAALACFAAFSAAGPAFADDGSDGVAHGGSPTARAQQLWRAYAGRLPEVREAVSRVPGGRAGILLQQAHGQFTLARTHAYLDEWDRCADAAALAVDQLEQAAEVARRESWERQQLVVALADMRTTLVRARDAVRNTKLDPLAASQLVLAEEARLAVDRLIDEGRVQAARDKAADARELAVIAIEQAFGAPTTPADAVAAGPAGFPGSGGDVD